VQFIFLLFLLSSNIFVLPFLEGRSSYTSGFTIILHFSGPLFGDADLLRVRRMIAIEIF
jgi:hypothetical protein